MVVRLSLWENDGTFDGINPAFLMGVWDTPYYGVMQDLYHQPYPLSWDCAPKQAAEAHSVGLTEG